MKEAGVRSSAARSAAVNSTLNGSGSMAALAAECEPNAVIKKGAECVSTAGAVVPDALLCPTPVVNGVVRLN